MSAYSDWRAGAVSDDEYRQACECEARMDEWHLDQRDLEEAEDE